MKFEYKNEHVIFPNGQLRPKETLVFEATVEESAELGPKFFQFLKFIETIVEKKKERK
jgi:hypothetical protein